MTTTSTSPAAPLRDSRASTPAPGVRIGEYMIQDVVGAGGAGRVYRVWDAKLKRSLALKLLPAAQALDETRLARFRSEVETLAAMNHPNIVRVFAAGDYEGSPWFTMDLIEGRDLEQLSIPRAVDPIRAAKWMVQVAEGVAYMHQRGVIHRDIKPANVLITNRGDAVLTDFGLAQSIERASDLTQTGVSVGTPAFMAPEQARGDRGMVGPAADVWQLGATLFAILAGRPPYSGDQPAQLMIKIAEGRPPELAGTSIPRPLQAVILKAMSPKPQQRYGSAVEFADDLNRWLDGEWVLARGGSAWMRKLHGARRYLIPLAVAMVGAAVVFAALSARSAPQNPLGPRGVFSADEESSLPLDPVEAELRREDGRFLLAANWHRSPRTNSMGELWSGLESRPRPESPGYGWGDFAASFTFRVLRSTSLLPRVTDDLGGRASPLRPRLDESGRASNHEAVLEDAAWRAEADLRPIVVCHLGSRSANPSASLALFIDLGRSRARLVDGGVELCLLELAPLPHDQPLVVTLSRRGLEISASVTLAGAAQPALQVRILDRAFDPSPTRSLERGIGIQTTAPGLEVAEISYQQFAERVDAPEFLVLHRMYPQAIDRIQARLVAADSGFTSRDRARLEYLRALCYLPEALNDPMIVKSSLSIAQSIVPSEFGYSAGLVELEAALTAFLHGLGELAPVEAIARRLRDAATTSARRGEIASVIVESARQLIAKVPTAPSAPGEEYAPTHILRASTLYDLAADEVYRDHGLCAAVYDLHLSLLSLWISQLADPSLRNQRESAGWSHGSSTAEVLAKLRILRDAIDREVLSRPSVGGQLRQWESTLHRIIEEAAAAGARADRLDIRAAEQLAERALLYLDGLGIPRSAAPDADLDRIGPETEVPSRQVAERVLQGVAYLAIASSADPPRAAELAELARGMIVFAAPEPRERKWIESLPALLGPTGDARRAVLSQYMADPSLFPPDPFLLGFADVEFWRLWVEQDYRLASGATLSPADADELKRLAGTRPDTWYHRLANRRATRNGG